MNIALIYHKDPYSANPRGGEKSVKAIVEYLSAKGHHFAMAPGPSKIIKDADLVLTWGKPALSTAKMCSSFNIPLILMVRWFRNICPLPAGNLMIREIEETFTKERAALFEYASAIITNTKYSKNVIHRWQPKSRGKVHVSYVPILGKFGKSQNKNGKITVITPEIYGENWLVNELAKVMPNERFLVVNSNKRYFKAEHPNIEETGYMKMGEVWKQTKIFLQPVYQNDICGTRRTTIEALKNGIPVIASDACGMDEKIPPAMLVPRKAKIEHWAAKIKEINGNYGRFRNLAKKVWQKYDTQSQLEQFEQILKKCVS